MKSLKLVQLALFATTVLAEANDTTEDYETYKVLGSFIFGRHNDRQAKPAKILTSWGATNQYKTGQFYRKRYFGIDSNETRDDSIDTIIDGLNEDGVFVDGEIYCEAPSSNVILFSHYSFLQGLYPPIEITDTDMVDETISELANGTVVENPLDGYQYVKSYIQENATDGYIWIKGDENCPSLNTALKAAQQTDQYLTYTNESAEFLESLWDYEFIQEYFDEDELTFSNVMNIYDEVYVNSIHNATVEAAFDEGVIATLKMWANRYQWSISDKSVNSSLTIGAQTLMARVVKGLNSTLTSEKPYLYYFTGSYNNMFQLNSVLDLVTQDDRFYTMPEYGCTYVFELLADSDDNPYVKFSFKNGTYELGDEFSSYPLFNSTNHLMEWDEFVSNVQKFELADVNSWCEACGYDEYNTDYILEMCVPYSDLYETAVELKDEGIDLGEVEQYVEEHMNEGDSSLTLAQAGGIGAGVTIGVFAIIGGLGYLLWKLRGKKTEAEPILPITQSESVLSKTSGPATTHMSGVTE